MIEAKVYTLGAIGVVPSIVYWILLAVLVIGVAMILFSKTSHRTQKIARLLLVECIVLIFCSAVLFRQANSESAINLVPFSSYFCIPENSYLLEVTVINMLNIIMFIPIGLLLRGSILNINWKGAMVVGLLISVVIEVLQFVFKRGLCEVDDVIHNVLGCMIGYGVANVIKKLTIDN